MDGNERVYPKPPKVESGGNLDHNNEPKAGEDG